MGPSLQHVAEILGTDVFSEIRRCPPEVPFLHLTCDNCFRCQGIRYEKPRLFEPNPLDQDFHGVGDAPRSEKTFQTEALLDPSGTE